MERSMEGKAKAMLGICLVDLVKNVIDEIRKGNCDSLASTI